MSAAWRSPRARVAVGRDGHRGRWRPVRRRPGHALRASGSTCSAKYLCYAIVAVGIGLAWGRGGMLVLGQGVFFGLGGYAMAMHLKLADAARAACPTS